MKTLKKIYGKMSLGFIVTTIVLLIGVLLILAGQWYTLALGAMVTYLAAVTLDGLTTSLEEDE